jgi:hypothetical protein
MRSAVPITTIVVTMETLDLVITEATVEAIKADMAMVQIVLAVAVVLD